MFDHKIDAEFIDKLTDARIAAHKEVEANTYYGFDPATRLGNFADSIENGLGGDVGKFLGMLDPETVFLIVDELVVRRRRMRNIRGLADYDLGYQADIPSPVVSKSGTAVVIPDDNSAVLRAEILDLKKERGHWKGLADTYKESFETSNETVKTSSETVKGLLEERLAIMERITDWENAYQGGIGIESDLTSRIAQLINAYGALYQSACEADKAHRGQDELLREVDVLGAYLKNPARETEAETRQMAVKAALTKIEEQDETIGALQQALVAAQSGQPRRPRGFTATGSESQPVTTWFEKVFKDLHDATDLERMPKLNGPLDEMLRRLFEK